MKLHLLSSAATCLIIFSPSSHQRGVHAQQTDNTTTTTVEEETTATTTTSVATTTPAAVTTTSTAAATATTTVIAPPPLTYTPEQCDAWTATALAADTTNSGGLNEAEYVNFLQSITDPSYVGEYFTSTVDSFTSLPYTARILYKIISCGCTLLPGYNATSCCTGANIEMPLDGFDNGNNITPEASAHRTYFCETLATLITKVPTPNPTSAPTVAPTSEPTRSPTMEPTTLAPTISPVISPTASPTINVTIPIPAVKAPAEEPEDNGGLSKGAIAGIIIAILLAILAALLLIAYLRHREQQRLREFASGNDDEDLGVEEEEDKEESSVSSDSSSEPSVWSESNERGDDMVDDVEEQKVTEASGVAAMGVASTVVTQMELKMGGGSE